MTTTKKSLFVGKMAAAIAEKAVRDAVKAITEKKLKPEAAEIASEPSLSCIADDMKYAYIFFNCDESKTPASMNIRYNDDVYGDYDLGRKELLQKLEEELVAGSITVSDMEAVQEAILTGEPTDANAVMQYGYIERLIMA